MGDLEWPWTKISRVYCKISLSFLCITRVFLDQELIPYRHSSSSCFLFFFMLGWLLHKSPRLHRFKLDRDEIWQECFSSKYTIHINWWNRISDMTSQLQDGYHDVILCRPCCGRKTARCHCKLRYIPKFTAASRGPPCAIARHLVCKL